MKNIVSAIAVLFILISCASETNKEESKSTEKSAPNSDSATTQISENKQTNKFSEADSNEIPPSGKFIFDVAFAEWQGKSMGVKVSVIIQGDSAKVIYEGHGDFDAKIGEVLDQGLIIKHKSGDWIIGSNASDKELDEIGGCTGGPAIIDFKNKKYWIC